MAGLTFRGGPELFSGSLEALKQFESKVSSVALLDPVQIGFAYGKDEGRPKNS